MRAILVSAIFIANEVVKLLPIYGKVEIRVTVMKGKYSHITVIPLTVQKFLSILKKLKAL